MPITRKKVAPLIAAGESRPASIAARIVFQRHHFGLKQAEVARAIGVTPGAITQYELGQTLPRRERVEALARLFKCTADYLLFGIEASADQAKTPMEVELLQLVRGTPEEAHPTILLMIRNLNSMTARPVH